MKASIIITGLSLFMLTGCEVLMATISEDSNAIVTAKYDVMKAYLKNPDTAYYENEKVHDKYQFTTSVNGQVVTITKFVISLDVTATNSLGAKMKDGYCMSVSTTSDKKYIVDVPPSKCTRGGPTAEEVQLIRSLAKWKTEPTIVK
ncbi:MAG: hypothetical protein ABL930_11545 [Pseudobdellovibrio sp.]